MKFNNFLIKTQVLSLANKYVDTFNPKLPFSLCDIEGKSNDFE